MPAGAIVVSARAREFPAARTMPAADHRRTDRGDRREGRAERASLGEAACRWAEPMPDRSDARIVNRRSSPRGGRIQHEKAILVDRPRHRRGRLDEPAALADPPAPSPSGRSSRAGANLTRSSDRKGRSRNSTSCQHTTGAELVVFDEELARTPAGARGAARRWSTDGLDPRHRVARPHPGEGKAQVESRSSATPCRASAAGAGDEPARRRYWHPGPRRDEAEPTGSTSAGDRETRRDVKVMRARATRSARAASAQHPAIASPGTRTPASPR